MLVSKRIVERERDTLAYYCVTTETITYIRIFFCFFFLHVQLLRQRFGRLMLFGFLSFAIFASHLSSILFTRSLYIRLPILVRLMTSWISQMLRMSSLPAMAP